jgi:twitching motility protein PilT
VNLLDSLLDAIIRLDADALVMHVGEKPYVVTASTSLNAYRGPLAWGQVELSSRVLTSDAVFGMLGQILPLDLRHALEDIGAIEFDIPLGDNANERFTVVAARGGDDVWLEVRRQPKPTAEVAMEAPPPAAEPGTAENHQIATASSEVVRAVDELVVNTEMAADDHEQELYELNIDEPEPASAETPPAVSESAGIEAAEEEEHEEFEISLDEVARPPATIPQSFAPATSPSDSPLEIVPDVSQSVPTDEEVDALLAQTAATLLGAATGEMPAAVPADTSPIHDAQPIAGVEEPVPAASGTPANRQVARLVDDLVKQAVAEAFEHAVDELVSPAATAAVQHAVERLVDQAVEEPAEHVVDQVVEQAVGEAVQTVVQEHVQPAVATAVENAVEWLAAQTVQLPVTQTAAEPVEPAVDRTVHAARPSAEERMDAVAAEPLVHGQEEPAAPAFEASAPVDASLDARRPAAEGPVGAQQQEPESVHVRDDAQPLRGRETRGEEAEEQRPALVVSITRSHVRPEPPAQSAAALIAPIEHMLRIAAARGASTVYVVAHSKPMIRVDGEISLLDSEPVFTSPDVERLVMDLAPARSRAGGQPGAEWMSDVPEVGRVRCVTFRDHRGPGVIFRMIPPRAISADQLGLTGEVQALCAQPDGLVLVAGPRASGKSTLLSAFVDLINRTRSDHVITIESQIGFVHESRRSFVSQREVRGDSEAAAAAVRSAFREDPDVLVIEDLRTPEIVAAALDAAESGRLVFGSLPAPSSVAAIERLVELMPADRRQQAQSSLAVSLRGVVAQVLLRKVKGGRIAAREVLLNTPSVAGLIAEGKLFQLPVALDSGRRHGMMPLNESLASLVREGTVHVAEAYRKALDRDGLITLLKRDGVDTSFAERLA